MHPLPFSKHLYRTNYPPRDVDVTVARRSLTECSVKLHSLEEQIIRLQTKRNVLSLEKQALATFIKAYRALFSPSSKLTHDVLQEIFYHCLPTVHPTVMSVNEPPLSLGRVCRRWRQIVYSTPKLWTSIHIIATPLSPTTRRDRAWKNAISSWLSRSGVLPLSISIHTSEDIVPSDIGTTANKQFQPYLDLIAPHIHRWRSLHLRLYKVHWVDILGQIQSVDVPLLEHLHVEQIYPSSPHPSFPEDFILYIPCQVSALAQDHGIFQAPRLRFLTLPSHLARDLRVHLQWKYLTSLDLRQVSIILSEVFEILAQCQSLISFTIGFNAALPTSWYTSEPRPSLTLYNLQKFSIIARPGMDDLVCQILDTLIAPSLVHLSYKRYGVESVWGQYLPLLSDGESVTRSLGGFLDGLLHPLEELELWCEPVLENLISDILRKTPGLRRLSLRAKVFSISYLTSLPFNYPIPHDPTWEQPGSNPINDSLLLQFISNNSGTDSVVQDSIFDMDVDDIERAQTCLCPNLEVLSISKVFFSHDVLLDFIRSRSIDHRKHRVARLRKISVHFSRPYPGRSNDSKEIDLQQQLVKLGKATGLQVFLHYPSLPETPPISLTLKPGLAYLGVEYTDDAPMYFSDFFVSNGS